MKRANWVEWFWAESFVMKRTFQPYRRRARFDVAPENQRVKWLVEIGCSGCITCPDRDKSKINRLNGIADSLKSTFVHLPHRRGNLKLRRHRNLLRSG